MPQRSATEPVSGNAEGCYLAEVACGKDVFYFQPKISPNWISTLVNNDGDFKDVNWGIRTVDDDSYI